MKERASFIQFIICYAIALAVVLSLHVVAQSEFAAIALFGSLMASLIAGRYHHMVTGIVINGRKALVFSLGAVIVWLVISALTFLISQSLFQLPLETAFVSNPSLLGLFFVIFLSFASIYIGLMASGGGEANE